MNTPPQAQAAAFFLPSREIASISPLGSGNVNDTYLVECIDGRRLVLQRVNPAVFPDPGLIMANMHCITGHLAEQIRSENRTLIRFPLLLGGRESAGAFLDDEGAWWRMLTYIEQSRTMHAVRKPSQATAIGSMLGYVHRLFSMLDPGMIGDPLPGFHVTPNYLRQFDVVVENATPRAEEEDFCLQCIAFWRHTATTLEEARHLLHSQVIHGDPKVANFLFAEGEEQVVSLIDLDTVGPGLLLHDLGDCLRSCCNPRGEEMADPAAGHFHADLFQALLAGYRQEAGHLLGRHDRQLLVDAVRLLTFELGLRFFADHLAGDRYFKISEKGQNLHRALVQFHLVRSLDSQRAGLERIVARLFRA